MSRSQHTRPLRIRAADRLRGPRAPRSRDDSSRRRLVLRALKEAGVSALSTETQVCKDWRLPRITVTRPRKDHHHPASAADVARVLRFFGEACCYGLRAVELRRGSGAFESRGVELGRLQVPGRILLFDQAHPPWRLRGLEGASLARLEKAGASVERLHGGALVIDWPGTTLRGLMLFDVLMHEVGHHLLQHHKGKRTVRIARTADHEAFADRFARVCRAAWKEAAVAAASK